MIDYLIWPWFERVEAWQLKQYDFLFIQEHNKSKQKNMKEQHVYLNQNRSMLYSSVFYSVVHNNFPIYSVFYLCIWRVNMFIVSERFAYEHTLIFS